MAKDQIRDLHLFAMESALPFGMGIINNAKTGGFQKIIDVLKSKDPYSEFQVDGKTSAKTVRDKIDKLIPGLGYPVVSVSKIKKFSIKAFVFNISIGSVIPFSEFCTPKSLFILLGVPLRKFSCSLSFG